MAPSVLTLDTLHDHVMQPLNSLLLGKTNKLKKKKLFSRPQEKLSLNFTSEAQEVQGTCAFTSKAPEVPNVDVSAKGV